MVYYSLTSTDEICDTSLLPLEKVSSLPTAQVQYCELRLQVAPEQYTLYPIIEVAHVENGALGGRGSEREREGERGREGRREKGKKGVR